MRERFRVGWFSKDDSSSSSIGEDAQRKKLGIHIVWVALVVTLIGDILMNMTYSDYVSSQPGALSTGVDIAFSGVCTLICGVIAAIPLMVSGSGMDDSKLFG